MCVHKFGFYFNVCSQYFFKFFIYYYNLLSIVFICYRIITPIMHSIQVEWSRQFPYFIFRQKSTLKSLYYYHLFSFQGYDYSSRRRLSTPSPSPTRETHKNGHSETTHGSWFKSLDRLARKKSKKVILSKLILTSSSSINTSISGLCSSSYQQVINASSAYDNPILRINYVTRTKVKISTPKYCFLKMTKKSIPC